MIAQLDEAGVLESFDAIKLEIAENIQDGDLPKGAQPANAKKQLDWSMDLGDEEMPEDLNKYLGSDFLSKVDSELAKGDTGFQLILTS